MCRSKELQGSELQGSELQRLALADLLGHLIGACRHGRWYAEVECLRGFIYGSRWGAGFGASLSNDFPIIWCSRRQVGSASASAMLVNPNSKPCPHACVVARRDRASTERPPACARSANLTSLTPEVNRASRCIPPGRRSTVMRSPNTADKPSASARRRAA